MYKQDAQEPCGTGCGRVVHERNRYFTGKYMTARDFQVEQDYSRSHRYLHNRLFHGWGIVCGLEVRPHPARECKDKAVVVTPGIAIDCCGRELVLEKEVALPIGDPHSPQKTGPEQKAEPDAKVPSLEQQSRQASYARQEQMPPDRAPEQESFLVCLRFVEQEIECVPVLYAEGPCDPSRREANRVREGAKLEVCDPDEVGPDCWRDQERAGGEAPCRDDCGDDVPGPAGACLKPDCPCGDCVPLALITRTTAGAPLGIDLTGRRHLPVPRDFMTHIVDTSWKHGQDVTLSELRENGGQLVITFDRKLQGRDGNKTGVNEYTFVVRYGGIQQDVEFLPYDERVPPRLEEGRRAVFTIDRSMLGTRRSIAMNTVYVTLKCDFILDCHGNAVDGDHMGGVLPTGNGTAGGVFESWFHVVPDGDEEAM